MKRDTKLDRLGQVPMFAACNRKELASVARAADEVEAPAGTVLIEEGTVGREFFIVLDGMVTVQRHGRDVAVLGAGAYFGELSLLDGQPRDATVTARTDVRAYVIDLPRFSALLEEVPHISRKLLAGLARRLHASDTAG